jgi:hypothetical protein
MGIRRVVVTRSVCDLCKKDIEDGAGKVGTLQVKTEGVRGRAEQWAVAFHETCYRGLISEATKPNGAGRSRGRPKGTRQRAGTASSRGRTSKATSGRR